MTCGALISILVCDFFLPICQCSSGGPLTVRTKAVWEFLEPLGGEIPARRTGHVCVTYGERIIMYVLNFYESLFNCDADVNV